MDIFIGLVVGLSFFVACVVSYCIGLKHGKLIANGNLPNVAIRNPIKAYAEHKEDKKAKEEQDKMNKAWDNIFNYDGTVKKKEGEED